MAADLVFDEIEPGKNAEKEIKLSKCVWGIIEGTGTGIIDCPFGVSEKPDSRTVVFEMQRSDSNYVFCEMCMKSRELNIIREVLECLRPNRK